MVSLRSLLGLPPVFFFATAIAAQTPQSKPPVTLRAQLMERLRAADSAGRREEAFLLRARLRDGDYEEGDRIDVSYEGAGLHKADTLVVMAGKVVQLGEPMGDLRVYGLLQPEVEDSIRARVDRYYKNEVVHVTPRLRLTVTGAIRTPGVIYARADMPLSDVLARAGGQDATTDLRNVVIRRGQGLVWGKEDVQQAITEGFTLSRLDLQAGDEIVVGARSGPRWVFWTQVGVSVLTAILIPVLIGRR